MPLTVAYAAERNYIEIVEELLKHDEIIISADPLIRSAHNGHAKIVLQIINKGVDVNATDRNGDAALLLASRSANCADAMLTGRTSVALEILNNGATVDVRDSNENTPLILAAEGNVQLAIELTKHSVNINVCNKQGITPLMMAIRSQSNDFIKLVLVNLFLRYTILDFQRSLDVNVSDNDGNTALTLAAEYGNIKLMQKLLECGANINAQNII